MAYQLHIFILSFSEDNLIYYFLKWLGVGGWLNMYCFSKNNYTTHVFSN